MLKRKEKINTYQDICMYVCTYMHSIEYNVEMNNACVFFCFQKILFFFPLTIRPCTWKGDTING